MKRLIALTLVVALTGCTVLDSIGEYETYKHHKTASKHTLRITDAQKQAAKTSIIARVMHPDIYAIYVQFPPYTSGNKTSSCKDVNDSTEICVFDNDLMRKACVYSNVSTLYPTCYKEYKYTSRKS